MLTSNSCNRRFLEGQKDKIMKQKLVQFFIEKNFPETWSELIADEILSLLAEKKNGDSGADSKNGDYSNVRKSHASVPDSESNSAPVELPLGKIIDSRNRCSCELPKPVIGFAHLICARCTKIIETPMEES